MAAMVKYRDLVHEIALDNHGYVTTRAAVEAGVPAVELPKLAARGGMENVAYGLYRVSTVPCSEIDQFAEALLRAGEGAYLYGESVLALLGLADVNPRRITVAVQLHAVAAQLQAFRQARCRAAPHQQADSLDRKSVV